MFDESMIIAGSAASIGFVHTILGPDHYLPLVAMAKTNGWSATKTASYVAVCGISHLLGTLLIGSLVFLLGFAFLNIETVQALRGSFAGWFLILFGLVYFAWGGIGPSGIIERQVSRKTPISPDVPLLPCSCSLFLDLANPCCR